MQGIRQIARELNRRLEDAIVGPLARNWRTVDDRQVDEHRDFIRRHYIQPQAYWDTEGGKSDLENLTIGRLHTDRRIYIPWIGSLLPLAGAQILEVGAGTGSSTVALAEQGARVTGVDILQPGIDIAREKCRIFGVEADLVVANFIDYAKANPARFDAVVFFASLEHMLIDERLQALPLAWDLLRPGGHLIVIEAPNRLWKQDPHTSQLPFFNWLPPELALRYIQFSPRTELVKLLTPPSAETLTELWRWGLGVSFHEFDLALGRGIRNELSGSLGAFLRGRSPLRRAGWHLSGDARFAQSLRACTPDVPLPWFEPFINLALRRP